MSALAAPIRALQDAPMPDFVTRSAIGLLVSSTRKRLDAMPRAIEGLFASEMKDFAIAEHAEAANQQHYELPADFFRIVLGPRLKYSSCLYAAPGVTLAQAEEAALAETVAHADLQDGQTILDLGCGWGSLTLYMAEKFPHARIVAVSNSHSQRAFINARARQRALDNIQVITADMNDFAIAPRFNRIVSVEMFEHMANWRALLTRARSWLSPEGRLFIHIFTHRDSPFRFDASTGDFIAQHFFTGGIMPSHRLIHHFKDLFEVEQEWRWSGEHYERTALDWLKNMDAHPAEIAAIMRKTYGPDAALWRRRWRRFFLTTAGLFGDEGGAPWGVSHYRLKAPS